jgi:hypothetical protein
MKRLLSSLVVLTLTACGARSAIDDGPRAVDDASVDATIDAPTSLDAGPDVRCGIWPTT